MKQELRKRCLKIRFQNVSCEAILNRLEQLVLKFSSIALYQHIGNELSLESLINKFFLSKNIYLPYSSPEICFRKFVDWKKMEEDVFHILAPIGKNEPIEHIEAIVLPCVACNVDGYRLGYGMGCYDRALTFYQGIKIGIINEACLLEESFQEEHDVPMNYIVTEKRILEVKKHV